MGDTQKHTKPNVPNLRFPGFEGEWESCELGEIAEFSKGAGISKDQRSSDGNPCILYGELYTTYLTEIIDEVVSKTNLDPTGLVRSKANDIIIPASGETAIDISTARCVLQNDVLLGGDLNIIRLFNQDGRFFSYQLNGIRKKDIARIAHGVSIVHLHGNALSHITVNYPSRSEQEKISSLLSLIDQRIAIQNKVIEDLKCVKDSITRRLINKKDESSCIVTLGEITEIVSRRNKSKVNYPMYSVTNDKGFVPQQEQFGDREMVGEDIGAYKIVLKDEIAYNPARINVGSIGQYTGDSPCMISSLYVCIKARKEIDSKWLIQILRSEHLIYYYNLFAEGGVRLYLFYPNFSRIRVTLPPLEQQSRIAAILGQIENKIELESSILSGYKQTKQALLCKLFV